MRYSIIVDSTAHLRFLLRLGSIGQLSFQHVDLIAILAQERLVFLKMIDLENISEHSNYNDNLQRTHSPESHTFALLTILLARLANFINRRETGRQRRNKENIELPKQPDTG